MVSNKASTEERSETAKSQVGAVRYYVLKLLRIKYINTFCHLTPSISSPDASRMISATIDDVIFDPTGVVSPPIVILGEPIVILGVSPPRVGTPPGVPPGVPTEESAPRWRKDRPGR